MSCMFNIEFYPFDMQNCHIWFVLSGYYGTEVELHAVNTKTPLQFYLYDGIWEIVKTESNVVGMLYIVTQFDSEEKPSFCCYHCNCTNYVPGFNEHYGLPIAS